MDKSGSDQWLRRDEIGVSLVLLAYSFAVFLPYIVENGGSITASCMRKQQDGGPTHGTRLALEHFKVEKSPQTRWPVSPYKMYNDSSSTANLGDVNFRML